MKRAFLLLMLLCLLPIHALAQFITVPDEIYEALLADEVISSYASTKEELLPLITTLEGCDENNQAECAVIVTPPDGNPELLMLGKVNGHWQITTRSSSVLLNIDIAPHLYGERYAEVQLYYSSEEDERNGVPRAVLTFQREWDDKAGLYWKALYPVYRQVRQAVSRERMRKSVFVVSALLMLPVLRCMWWTVFRSMVVSILSIPMIYLQ